MAGRPTKRDRTRWLVRRDGAEYGPYSTDQLLEEIALRRVDLGTPVCDLARREWNPAGEHAPFRDHYAQCIKRWEVEALEADVDKHERKLKAMDNVKGGAWRLMVVGLVLATALGSWIVWRILKAEPTGIADAVAVPELPALPDAPQPRMTASGIEVLAAGTKVAVLKEYENYDTAGVGSEAGAAAAVTRFDFEGGEGGGLDPSTLKRILGEAKAGLVGCAQQAATRSASFKGTKVTFVVRSGRLDSFTVGREALSNAPFKACVKGVLKRVKVPRFAGSDHKVSFPLVVQ